MLPIRNISYLSSMCCNVWEKCKNSHKSGLGCSTPLSGCYWASEVTIAKNRILLLQRLAQALSFGINFSIFGSLIFNIISDHQKCWLNAYDFFELATDLMIIAKSNVSESGPRSKMVLEVTRSSYRWFCRLNAATQ